MFVNRTTALALVLLCSTAHAQQRDPDQQLRELDAQLAARRAHADAVHAQLRIAAEQQERQIEAKNAAARAHADAVLAQQRADRQQAAAATCTESWPARLADAKQALAQFGQASTERKRAGADVKIAWFDAHCRFLSELEIAIRKVDDPNAFVCDTTKGRPSGLTPAFVLQHAQPPQLLDYQERLADDRACEPFDAAERVSLVLSDADDRAGVEQRLRVLCFDDARPACVKARDDMEATAKK